MWSAKKSDKVFEPHPDGTFMAVCRDVYEYPNPKFGQINSFGKPEPRMKVRIEFLTDEPIEINGQMLPRFISAKFNPSWDEKSSLRKFVSCWIPKLGKQEECDPESLVGQGAYLTITHDRDRTNPDKAWANIASAAPPPKGATIPQIPVGFVRHKDKPKDGDAAPVTNDAPANYGRPPKPGSLPIGDDDDGLPF